MARIHSHLMAAACAAAWLTAGCGDLTGNKGPRLTTIEIGAPKTQIAINEQVQLTATAKDQNGDPFPASGYTWTANPTSVAEVSGTGQVTGKGTGTAVITATSGGKSATFNLTVQGSLHTQDVTADETWRAADNPHFVVGVINVRGSGAPTLTMEAGVEVRFASSAGLVVGGSQAGVLKALGTSAAPIRLVADAASPTAGFWRNLVLASGSGASELRNVTLRHCGGGVQPSCLRIEGGSTPIVENMTVENSGGRGVVLAGGAAFGTGSAGLTVTGSAAYPIEIQPNVAGTIPTGGTFTGNTPNAVQLVGGVVGSSQTWPNLGIPYVVTARVDIDGSGTPTLTLPAGTEVRFASGQEMLVGNASAGVLIADGTAEAPVRFTADAASPTPGFWRGIHVRQTGSSATRLTHAVIEYCGSAPPTNDACLTMHAGAAPVVQNVTVRHSNNFGVAAGTGSAFGAGSTNLTVTGTAKHPVRIRANYVATIPTGGQFTGNTPDAILVESDNVSVTQTWPNLGVPYVISGDTRVQGAGAPVLTLVAGTELRFASGWWLLVGDGAAGALVVEGTAESPVKFTADAATASPGHWRSVQINSQASGATKIDHAIFEFAGQAIAGNSGLVYVRKEMGGIITNSIFRNSATCGIHVHPDVTTDFTDAALGNTFTGNVGAAQCKQ